MANDTGTISIHNTGAGAVQFIDRNSGKRVELLRGINKVEADLFKLFEAKIKAHPTCSVVEKVNDSVGKKAKEESPAPADVDADKSDAKDSEPASEPAKAAKAAKAPAKKEKEDAKESEPKAEAK